jgi:hypothetical protein
MSWSHVRLRDCRVRLEISSVYGYYDINSIGLKTPVSVWMRSFCTQVHMHLVF